LPRRTHSSREIYAIPGEARYIGSNLYIKYTLSPELFYIAYILYHVV